MKLNYAETYNYLLKQGYGALFADRVNELCQEHDLSFCISTNTKTYNTYLLYGEYQVPVWYGWTNNIITFLNVFDRDDVTIKRLPKV